MRIPAILNDSVSRDMLATCYVCMSCDISLEACLERKNLAIFHDAVSSGGAAWCSRSSHTPTLAAKSLWVHGWKTKGLSSIDPGHTLSSTSPCSSQSRCIKSYQVIRMQYKLSCQKISKNAKPPNLQKVHNEKLQLLQDAKASRRLWSRSWRLERSWGPARAASPKIWV